jgi:hypothetical protein
MGSFKHMNIKEAFVLTRGNVMQGGGEDEWSAFGNSFILGA